MSEKKQNFKKSVAKTGAIAAAKAPAKAPVKAAAKPTAVTASGKSGSGAKIAPAAKISHKATASLSATASLKPKSIAVTKPSIATRVTTKPALPASNLAQSATTPVRKVTSENSDVPPLALKKKLTAKRQGRAIRLAKFSVGQVVRHRIYPFRGVVFDIDPVFANTDEWLAAIPPDVRPRKNQPFYHLLAESAETEYIAYVSEQNLLPDETGQPLRHPQINEYFVENDDGTLRAVFLQAH